jgi:hypothetical protein
MRKVGLIRVRAEQYYNIYEVDFERFGYFQAQLTAVHLADRVINSEAIDQEAYQQQIIAKWVVDGSIDGVPSQIQHRPVLIEWLTKKFDDNRRYGQEQLGDVLAAFCSPACQNEWRKVLLNEGKLCTNKEKAWYWRADSAAAQRDGFVPEMLPIAQLSAAIQAPRMRNGRLTVSHDPDLLKRNLLHIALRLQGERPYTPDEIDVVTSAHNEGDPAFYRKALIEQDVIHLQDDGTYQRDPLGPHHPIWSR